ncbi:DNA-formamidopyrimidine glycosylase [Singulisphaera sp. PoT]|uniref:DNA-formamidopyrimidine glycosylase n=1 Tax=Singulisphaera sp. PoT TaxID=3411797 RepID=UPI003BF54A33
MPELPEVETMVRGLRPALEGMLIRDIQVLDPFLLEGCTTADIERQGRGAKVARVDRRGKWVVIHLDRGRGLIVIQPRMTGGFWLVTPERQDHVRLTFLIDGPRDTIWFCDTRRLGKIAWYPDEKAASVAFGKSHGPDALEITQEDLFARLSKTTRAIKPTLMDQKVLAGIGNIYADEVLFRSRIHPTRPATTITAEEVARLHAAIGSILREAILAEGSSFDAGYRTVLGLEGGFLATNAMYGRGGQPCPECGKAVEKTRIAGLVGRPTHFCANCQPLTPPKPSRKKSQKA